MKIYLEKRIKMMKERFPIFKGEWNLTVNAWEVYAEYENGSHFSTLHEDLNEAFAECIIDYDVKNRDVEDQTNKKKGKENAKRS